MDLEEGRGEKRNAPRVCYQKQSIQGAWKRIKRCDMAYQREGGERRAMAGMVQVDQGSERGGLLGQIVQSPGGVRTLT